MPSSTLTAKGQTTIPREIRERLRIKPGDRIDFVVHDDGMVALHARTRHVTELAGLLHRPGQRPISIKEIDKAIMKAVVARDRRSRRRR